MSTKKVKSKPIRLAQKANDAFKILADTKFKQRIIALEKVNEFGFALLIHWNRVEIALKLRQYYNKIETFPEKLDFIDKRIPFIKHLFSNNQLNYDTVLEGPNSIWKTRNKIAHASFSISKPEYEIFKTNLILFENNILNLIPKREEYLTKRKSCKNFGS